MPEDEDLVKRLAAETLQQTLEAEMDESWPHRLGCVPHRALAPTLINVFFCGVCAQ
jgi:hypothetical protein